MRHWEPSGRKPGPGPHLDPGTASIGNPRTRSGRIRLPKSPPKVFIKIRHLPADLFCTGPRLLLKEKGLLDAYHKQRGSTPDGSPFIPGGQSLFSVLLKEFPP